MIHGVPNPATPRQLRPVEVITDRARRYRANRNPPAGPRLCAFCGAGGRLDIDHIDGHEFNDAARNKMYLCRSCNTRKGVTQARAGQGTRTRQYNPEGKAAAPPVTFAQYVDAVLVLRGDRPGNAAKAARVMQATPPERRASWVERIRRARNPDATAPTYQQYVYAVGIHDSRTHAHDEGGAIIHATPKALRREYARQIASTKRQRGTDRRPGGPDPEEVPF